MQTDRAARFIQNGPAMREHNDWTSIAWVGVFFIVSLAAIYAVYNVASKMAAARAVSPIDTVKERYARGELTKEQYIEIKKELAAK